MKDTRARMGLALASAAIVALAAACSSGGTSTPENSGTPTAGSQSSPGGATSSASKGGGNSVEPSGGSSAAVINKDYAGTTITVIMPPYGALPKDMLAKFKAATGIDVKMQSLDWNAIHDKIVTSEAAGQAPADVVEMDWSWVAQFGAAGWFEPLNDHLTADQISASVGASAFQYDGKQIGLPYSLDFRGTTVNMTMLKKAGIDTAPTTWDELISDAKKIKDAGVVQYPIGLPLKVLEGTTTPWYALVRGSGGQIFDQSGNPAFADGSTGADALSLIRTLYADGLVDPGSIGLTDAQVGDNQAAGKSAIVLSSSPGSLVTLKDPKQSKVSKDDFSFVHVPGKDNNTGPSIGLQEALSIPKQSEHKDAAAMFISWWTQPAQLVAIYQVPDLGNLPPNKTALDQLSQSGKLLGGQDVLNLADTVGPVAEGGVPTWYDNFSSSAAAIIQAVALGHTSPQDGIASLEKQAKTDAAGA